MSPSLLQQDKHMAINILVTEDESIVRKDIERCLDKLGYNVVATADNGEKAIELALKHKPDLALMDIMIKGDMTGIAAAEEIKRNLDIPVVFLTAYADENTLSQAKLAEPHGYILKPFKEVDIQTAVEMALHKHSKEMELKTEADFAQLGGAQGGCGGDFREEPKPIDARQTRRSVVCGGAQGLRCGAHTGRILHHSQHHEGGGAEVVRPSIHPGSPQLHRESPRHREYQVCQHPYGRDGEGNFCRGFV